MIAQKANKVYHIDERLKDTYLKDGYDIYNDKGEMLERSPLTKISYSEYEKVANENKALRMENESLKASVEATSDKDVIEILSAFAQEHGVELGRTSSVAGIVKKIKEHQQKAGE